MTDRSTTEAVTQAMTVAQVRAWRTSLLDLHKVLVDAELLRYAADHGPISGPHHALTLLSNDPWFQWMRPMIVLVVQMDERLADRRPLGDNEVASFRNDVRSLLQAPADPVAEREYRRSLQELPAAVVIHGRLLELLKKPRHA